MRQISDSRTGKPISSGGTMPSYCLSRASGIQTTCFTQSLQLEVNIGLWRLMDGCAKLDITPLDVHTSNISWRGVPAHRVHREENESSINTLRDFSRLGIISEVRREQSTCSSLSVHHKSKIRLLAFRVPCAALELSGSWQVRLIVCVSLGGPVLWLKPHHAEAKRKRRHMGSPRCSRIFYFG